MNYRGRRRRLQLTKLMPALQDCARRIRRREWRLMPSVRSVIIIGWAIILGIGQAHAGEFDSILRWRNIGPYRGGRTQAICGVPSQPNVFYKAPVNGGVFKTHDYRPPVEPTFADQPKAAHRVMAGC